MNKKSLISILIVAYNPGEYLRNTLMSCLDQTYENTEILILDNGSTENILQYIPENPKIDLIRNEKNLGPYKGLNMLLEKARGVYIAIQDHDDIWHREKLEKQVDLLESHPQYIGCGTKTIMYYESDKKYFEYYLGEENYYTIHPSLLFRYNGVFRYDTSETEYMCDAYSMKYSLCHGKKRIVNIDESLTLHLIKRGGTNYSYRWHTLTWTNIKQVYKIHSPFYASLTIVWEIIRKMLYQILQNTGLVGMIDRIERVPFRIFGKKIKTTQGDKWWKKYSH